MATRQRIGYNTSIHQVRVPMTGYTPHQAKFFAHVVTREGIAEGEGLAQSLSAAKVDLNPHQVDVAMSALRSPLSKGVLLADEVELGKTIEAALVITQRWLEGRRHLILITPTSNQNRSHLPLERWRQNHRGASYVNLHSHQ